MEIVKSATKIVLLLVIVTLCYLAIRQIEIPATFKDIVLMIVSFYFGGKMPETKQNTITATVTKDVPPEKKIQDEEPNLGDEFTAGKV